MSREEIISALNIVALTSVKRSPVRLEVLTAMSIVSVN